jgi:sugar phosphate isomerase/epimerase
MTGCGMRDGGCVNPDRRGFVKTLGAFTLASFGLSASRIPYPASRIPHPASRLGRIGLQLYTVRAQMAKDFEGTLARVARVGYREVEFAGYFDKQPQEVWRVLERYGLSAPAAHVPYEALKADWEATLEDARTLGHRYLVVPSIPQEERRTLDGWRRVAREFNRAAVAVQQAGLQFAYHNHDFEFARIGTGTRLGYDVLLAETDPTLVLMEMDLYWITKGGGDPLAYFERWPGRFALVHVKDMRRTRTRPMTEVGRGVIDFKEIFAQREQAGIQHFFVEHDHPADAFASIRTSYEYLRRLEF